MKEFKLIEGGIPIGFFKDRIDAERALGYVETGFITERDIL